MIKTDRKVKEVFYETLKYLCFAVIIAVMLLAEYILLYDPGMWVPFSPILESAGRRIVCIVAGIFLGVSGIVAMFVYLKVKKTEVIAIAMIFFFGVLISISSPVLNGFDEQAHFFKSVATLDGKMLNFDSYNYGISDSYILLKEHQLETSIFNPSLSTGWLDSRTYVDALTNGYPTPTYPTYGYLFCCFGLLIARILHLSTGMCFLAGRLFNLIGYTAMIYVAFRMIPNAARGFKAVMTLYACLPGNLFVAAHYSQDGAVYGIIAILVALFVKMYFSEKVGRRDFIVFGVLFLLLVPLKFPYIVLGFLLLLIPYDKYDFKLPYLWICLLALTSLVIAGVWLIFVSSQYTEPRVENVDGVAQILFMLRNFPTFAKAAVFTFFLTLPSYIGNTMRLAGAYDLYTSTGAGIIFVGIFLVLSALCMGETELKKTVRIRIALMALLIVFGTTVAMYASYNTVGESEYIAGVQIRYFYPLLLLIPLSLSGKIGFVKKNSTDIVFMPVVLFAVLELIWFVYGFLLFYV